ncbi:hypothetical protein JZ785_21100 [Alicyclobacillus curvatus]|nr:hypothetical protein JZ785_21100 [Alicyclobacillus curvatus]
MMFDCVKRTLLKFLWWLAEASVEVAEISSATSAEVSVGSCTDRSGNFCGDFGGEARTI